MQSAVQGFSQEQFFYGFVPGTFFDPSLAFLSRDDAIAIRSTRGGSVFSIYPIDRFRRIEFSVGLFDTKEKFDNPTLAEQSDQYQQQQFGTSIFRSGRYLPLGLALIQETTVFRGYGPLSGSTFRLSYEFAPPGGDAFLSRQTIDIDARKYWRISENGVLALRGRGFKS